MSFGSSSAAAYLGGFTPIAPVAGFRDVESQVGTQALMAIPAGNMAAQLDLAGKTLDQLGAIEQVKLAQKGALDRLNAEIAYNTKNNRRYAGAAIAQVLGSLGGLGGLQLPQRKDPRQMQLEQESYEAQVRAARQGRNANSTEATGSALKLIS